jgi:hypothetical protein
MKKALLAIIATLFFGADIVFAELHLPPQPIPLSPGPISVEGLQITSPGVPAPYMPPGVPLNLDATATPPWTGPAVSCEKPPPAWQLTGPGVAHAAPACTTPLNGPAVAHDGPRPETWPLAGPAVVAPVSHSAGLLNGPALCHDTPACPEDQPCFTEPAETPDRSRVWASVEWLIWWEKQQPFPSNLVTTGSPTDPIPGALGQPGTHVMFGPSEVGYGAFAGVRASVGAWLDPQQIVGIEFGGFVLEDRAANFGFASAPGGSSVLALPYSNPSGAANAFLIAAPTGQSTKAPTSLGAGTVVIGGQVVGPTGNIVPSPNTGSSSPTGSVPGGVAIHTDSQLWGTECNLIHPLCWSDDFHLVASSGIRYLNLGENIAITTDKQGGTFLGQSISTPLSVQTDDSFHTGNQFYGAQLGLAAECSFWGRCFTSVRGTLALGGTEEMVNVGGISTLQPGKAVPGGLYALASNSGRFHSDDFGIIPELQIKGGVQITSWCQATLGYNFLYWSRVLRAGDQIDTTIDARQVPSNPAYQPGTTAAFPRPLVTRSDFWAQGISLGLEFIY